MSADPARRTPPSAPPAGQRRRSPQAFPPAAPAPRHGEELELRKPWLSASSSTAAQRGLPVQVTGARRAPEGDEEEPGTRWTVPHVAGCGTGKLRRNSFPQAGHLFFLPLCGLEAGKEEVKTLRALPFVFWCFYLRSRTPQSTTSSNLSFPFNSFFGQPFPNSVPSPPSPPCLSPLTTLF